MQLRALPKRRKLEILAGVLLAMLLGALDATIVGPAMPNIVQELGGMSLYSWVFIIYSLSSTIAIPIVGKLSDLYGRKWFYLAGIALFLLGSMLSGAAQGMLWLIVARGVQGLGGGMMMANGMAVIGDLFEPRERAKYQGLMGATFGLASVLGPAVGGWLTDAYSWRWIFYVNVPIGLAALAVLFVAMPKPEHGQEHDVDWWGATALTAGLVPLLLALNWGGSKYEWGSTEILALFGAALIALLAFVMRELRASEPILDIRLFLDRGFSASMTVLFLSGVGMFGSIMFLPLFMQVVQGQTASNSGALLMPMMISMVLASITTGQLISRTGRFKIFGLFGLAAAALGMYLLSTIGVNTSNGAVVGAMILIGSGIGVTMPLFTISLQSQFQTRIGEVTGALQFFRSIGGTVGVALLGGVMNAAFSDSLTALVARDAAKFGPAAALLGKLTAEPGKLLNQGALAAVAAKIPAEAQAVFTRFLIDVKIALAAGVSDAFFWAFIMMSLAFVAMFFVREVPLSAHPRLDSAAEIGTEILAEEAVQPAEHEPVIVDADSESPDEERAG